MTTVAKPTLHQFVAANMQDNPDYYSEARRVLSLMSPEDRDDYLVEMMIPVIRNTSGRRRRDAFDRQRFESQVDTSLPEEETTPRAKTTLEPSPPRAPKQQQNFNRQQYLRDAWSDLMSRDGIAAGGGRKPIRDMNHYDLVANINQREKNAAANLKRAEQFRAILKQMEAEGVDTVGEIRNIPSL